MNISTNMAYNLKWQVFFGPKIVPTKNELKFLAALLKRQVMHHYSVVFFFPLCIFFNVLSFFRCYPFKQIVFNSKIFRMFINKCLDNKVQISFPLRILTPPIETPNPPNDTPIRASKLVVLTPHHIIIIK